MSNFVFTESINDVDKFSVIEIAKADARMMKLDALYEAVNATLASNYAEAEIKVFEENGTYDDLYMLYREASEEATEKKENIIQKIIGVIKTLCQNIKKFFTEKIAALKGGKSDEKQADEVQLDKAYPETMNIFQKILAKIKEVFGAIESKAHDKIKKVSEDASEFWEKNKTLIVCGGAGAAITGTLVFIKRDVIMGWINGLHKENEEVNNKLAVYEKKTDLVSGFASTVAGAVGGQSDDKDGDNRNTAQKVIDAVTNAIKKAFGFIRDVIAWIFKFIADLFKKLTGKSDSTDNSDSTEEAPANGGNLGSGDKSVAALSGGKSVASLDAEASATPSAVKKKYAAYIHDQVKKGKIDNSPRSVNGKDGPSKAQKLILTFNEVVDKAGSDWASSPEVKSYLNKFFADGYKLESVIELLKSDDTVFEHFAEYFTYKDEVITESSEATTETKPDATSAIDDAWSFIKSL